MKWGKLSSFKVGLVARKIKPWWLEAWKLWLHLPPPLRRGEGLDTEFNYQWPVIHQSFLCNVTSRKLLTMAFRALPSYWTLLPGEWTRQLHRNKGSCPQNTFRPLHPAFHLYPSFTIYYKNKHSIFQSSVSCSSKLPSLGVVMGTPIL